MIFFLFYFCSLNFVSAQTTLNAGEIAFIGLYMDGLGSSGEKFTFILLRDLEANTVIYFTDEGWDATNTTWYGNTNDAHFSWTVPTGGLLCGTIVQIENTTATTYSATSGTVSNTLSGIWNLSSSGDQILAYQSSSGVRPASPTFITAADADYYIGSTYDGPNGWGASYYNQNYCSDLPPGLTNGSTCLALVNANTAVQGGYAIGYECDNYKYTGTLTGTALSIRNAINTNSNWTGNEDGSLSIAVNSYSTPNITDPLPVELTSFGYSFNGKSIHLNWETATEINNYGFEIERNSKNSVWEKIGFIAGHGNSNSPKFYNFIDSELKNGTYQYRLKQIDIDGSFELSNIIKVQVNTPSEFQLYQNYPNPFNPSTTITYGIPNKDFVKISVFNSLGEEVKTLLNEEKEAGTYNLQINMSEFSSGVYYYKLSTSKFNQVKKMILMK